MNFIKYQELLRNKSNIKSIACAIFFLFFFFSIFGTSLPFQETDRHIEEIQSSNKMKQFIFPILYFISFLCILSKKEEFILFIKKEKYLTLFLLWCLLSIIWSDNSFVSFKRWFQVFGAYLIIISTLFHVDSTEQIVKFFKFLFAIYVPLSLLAILFVPEARQWDGEVWRGLASHKNVLGQISLASILVWLSISEKMSIFKKLIHFVLLIMSCILLVGTKSTTALIVFVCIIIILLLKKIISYLYTSSLRSLFIFTTFLCLIFILMIPYVMPETINWMFNIIGKDATFTGRTELWLTILNETKKHFLFGCGFEGFWIIGYHPLMLLYEDFIWLPTHSHQGYLDLLNETGMIGFLIVILMIVSYFIKLIKYKTLLCYKLFFLSAIIFNFTESTLFRLHDLIGLLFIFSYSAINIESIKEVSGDGLLGGMVDFGHGNGAHSEVAKENLCPHRVSRRMT